MEKPIPRETGNAAAGRDVFFRFETFGNEGFWTDAVPLPKGVKDAKLTPVQALRSQVYSIRRARLPANTPRGPTAMCQMDQLST